MYCITLLYCSLWLWDIKKTNELSVQLTCDEPLEISKVLQPQEHHMDLI